MQISSHFVDKPDKPITLENVSLDHLHHDVQEHVFWQVSINDHRKQIQVGILM